MKIILNDTQLHDLNQLFGWWAIGTSDQDGRCVGVDPVYGTYAADTDSSRVSFLKKHVGLAGKRILEPGCLDGFHTLQLDRAGARVTSFDIRPINVLRTYARGVAFGRTFDVRIGDAETMHESFSAEWDILFHCGLLYHLSDPVTHLRLVANMARYLMLDTQLGRPEATIEVNGHWYEGHIYEEQGWADPLSGKQDLSFVLTEASILSAANSAGLALVDKATAWSPDRMFFLFAAPGA